MLSKIFISALVAVASAAPLVQRSCTEGLYNCFDGKTYAQCVSGGTWGITMSVAPGTTCNIGISANPFIPGGEAAPAPAPAPSTTAAAPPPQPTITNAPPPPPAHTTAPPPPATTAAPTTAAPPVQPTTPSTPSGDCTNNAAGGKFADESCWLSWEAMKTKYLPIMGKYCDAWGASNSAEETSQVFKAIEDTAGSVDKRFILSLVQQESTGCVRVITTNNGVRNPGLLQDSNGAHTCNEGGIKNPCPEEQIHGMINDGVNGGDNNLAKALKTANAAGFLGAKGYAVAARIYNSGSYDANNLANGLGSTGAYVDQILNRLTGTQT